MENEKELDKKKKKTSEKGVNNQIELEPVIKEAILSPMQRRHRAIVMKRHAPKIKAARRRAAKRIANTKKLKGRSRKHAINTMRSKVAGQKGKNYKSLSASEKSSIDKRVQNRGAAVTRIAARLLPKVKRSEQSKFSKKKRINESFEKVPMKRFHELFTKDNKVKADKRFKINRKTVQKEEVEDIQAIYAFVLDENKMSKEDREKVLGRIRKQQSSDFQTRAIDTLHKAVTGDKNKVKSVGSHAFDVARQFAGMSGRELEAKYRAIHEEHGAGEDGTTALKKKYIKDTPYQVDPDPKSVNEAFENLFEAKVTMKQMKAFEAFIDKLFKKFDIDFEFTKHFADRMGDERNNPDIAMQELADFVKKILAKKGENLKAVAGDEAVMKDLQADLNIPVVVKYDSKNKEFDVVAKTIMRKKNFKTPNKVLTYK